MEAIKLFDSKDLEEIHTLLTSNHWEYFLDPVITSEALQKRDGKYFSSTENKTLVYKSEEGKLLGSIRFFEIEDNDTSSPDFAIYVDASVRGKGIGQKLLTEGVRFIFENYKNIRRIEATTRCDNIAMQKLFEAGRFTQEAHYRKIWKNKKTGGFMDAYGYAILKDEL